MFTDKKDYFTIEEVKKAEANTIGVIIGAETVIDVHKGMKNRNLTKINKFDLSDSERECIEFGLGYQHWIK